MTMNFCPKCGKPLSDRTLEGRTRRVCADASCGYIFYDNPTPVVAGVVEHEGNVLLVRNHGWPEKMFGLVSGFLERNESPSDGMLRELREELGLEGEIVRLIGVYPFEMMNQLIVAYHVKASGTVKVGDELAGYKAIAPDKLRPWEFGTGQAVKDWLASRK
jgi:NADH pyrophosphatase NudC (nudix superfamily)